MADGFAMADDSRAPRTFARSARRPNAPLTIGLVNNMPDAALAGTEAQFRGLIDRAADGRPVTFHLFSLPSVPRSDAARAAMARRYLSTDALPGMGIGALIVTGAEPIAADLRDEPFWPDLAALIDWAEANTVSTIFSCLAAHAAVLHLDGVQRRPLDQKCSGVFDLQMTDHALTEGQAAPPAAPHSRWNTLGEAALKTRGYTILTRSAEIGVDAFIRDRNSLFLFLQGHPEYEADTLMLEYRRDVRRFLIGERASHPSVPVGYFDPTVEQALIDLALEASRHRNLSALSDCTKILRTAAPHARWARTTATLYSNWIDLLAARVAARL